MTRKITDNILLIGELEQFIGLFVWFCNFSTVIGNPNYIQGRLARRIMNVVFIYNYMAGQNGVI
jgi:hypothetical protein